MKAFSEIGFKKACKYVLGEIILLIFKFMILSPMRIWYLRLLGASIGKNAVIHDISFFNCYGKGFRALRIGDNCFIGNQCLFDLAESIELGNNVTLAERVTIITHLNVGYKDHGLQKFFPNTRKKVVIQDDVFIGVNSTVLSGIVIKSGSFIGAMSLINRDVPEDSLVAGVPAKLIRAIN